MKTTIASYIRCPYCHSACRLSRFRKSFGILSCGCDEYPIVAGIVFLRKDDALSNRRAVGYIKEEKNGLALRTVMSGSRIQKGLVYGAYALSILGLRIPRRILLRLLSYVSSNARWFRYLLDPRDMELSRTTSLLSRKPHDVIVDMGCGIGYLFEELMRRSLRPRAYIGVDKNMSSLLLARTYIDKNILLCCADADMGFPLRTSCASAVVFLDSLAYIHRKENSLIETARVLVPKGNVYIVHMYESTPKTRWWGYGIKTETCRGIMKKYFCHVSCFDRVNERYSCSAQKT